MGVWTPSPLERLSTASSRKVNLHTKIRKVATKKWLKMYQRKRQQQKKKKTLILKIFYGIESAEDKLLEADPNLERSTTISPGAGKTLAPCSRFDDRKKANTIQKTLDKLFTKNKIL